MMKYFSISELVRSAKATALNIDNRPQLGHIINMESLITHVLDPIRERFGQAIYVNSGYRCRALNVAVGGARNSAHTEGRAADIRAGQRKDNARLLQIISEMAEQLPLGQVISECESNGTPAWIHVEYRMPPTRQFLRS